MCVSETVLLHDKMEKINSMLLEQDTWQANFWFQLMHNVDTCKGTRLWKSDTPMDLNQLPMPQNTMLECYVPMLQCDINNTSPKNAEVDARDYRFQLLTTVC